MILLFGEKANKTHSSHRNSNVKNHPVENSGILAMDSPTRMRSLLEANEYDTYMFSKQAEVDYSQYSDDEGYSLSCIGFMSEFSDAISMMDSDGGFASFGDCSGSSFSSASSCSSSFSSVC